MREFKFLFSSSPLFSGASILLQFLVIFCLLASRASPPKLIFDVFDNVPGRPANVTRLASSANSQCVVFY